MSISKTQAKKISEKIRMENTSATRLHPTNASTISNRFFNHLKFFEYIIKTSYLGK